MSETGNREERFKNKKGVVREMVIKEGASKLRKEIKSKAGIAIAGAFALVMAFAWKDFIRDVVTKIVNILGLSGETYIFQFAAAVFVTVICVVGIIYFSKWGSRK